MDWGSLIAAAASMAAGYASDKSGKDSKAHRYAKQRNAEVDAYIKQMQEQSRNDLMGLWPGAMDNANMGYQAALDMFGQSIPQQMGAFTQGNMNAQGTLLAGMDPYMAALMGNPIDMSGLQPRGVDYDTSWIPQQLPEYKSVSELLSGQPNGGGTYADPFDPAGGAAQPSATRDPSNGGMTGGTGDNRGGFGGYGGGQYGGNAGINDRINDLVGVPLEGRDPGWLEQFLVEHGDNLGMAASALSGVPGLGQLARILQNRYWQNNQWQSPIPDNAPQPGLGPVTNNEMYPPQQSPNLGPETFRRVGSSPFYQGSYGGRMYDRWGGRVSPSDPYIPVKPASKDK